jgi:type IV pilus assembly protein PilC
MPLYRYKSITEDGVVEKGEISAPDWAALKRHVEKDGRILVKASAREEGSRFSHRYGKIKVSDLTDLLIYLSITNSSGIPVTTALEDFIEQTRRASFKKVLKDILTNVQRGLKLSEAFAKYQGYFGTIFINVVKAGEETGSLDVVMDKLRSQLDWQTKIKSTIKQALVYPAFLILAVSGLVVLLLTFLLPRIMGIYSESDIELPMATQVLISVSDFMRGNWLPLLCGVLSVPAAVIITRRFKSGKIFTDRMLFKVPAIGRILSEISLARFTVVLKTMLSSGVEIVKSIDISGSSTGNTFIEKLSQETIEDVKNGKALSVAIEKFKEMNLLLPRMITIGEKTGRIGEALDCAYNYFDLSIPKKVNKMISMIEPSIIIVAGILVGFILLGALLPIYTMYSGM